MKGAVTVVPDPIRLEKYKMIYSHDIRFYKVQYRRYFTYIYTVHGVRNNGTDRVSGITLTNRNIEM